MRLLPQSRAERLIATSRLVLAVASLLAIWVDPIEPARHAATTYSLLIAYSVYAFLLAIWNATTSSYHASTRYLTHAVDLLFFTAINFLTEGPTSPFFVYFVFSLVCAILRFGLVGTAITAAIAVGVFFGSGILALDSAAGIALNSFIIRSSYLAVVASLLLHFADYQRRRISELKRIATWTRGRSPGRDDQLGDLLEQSSVIAGARRILLAYECRGVPVFLYGYRDDSEFVSQELPANDAKLLLDEIGEEPVISRDARRDLKAGAGRWPLFEAAGSRRSLPPELLERFAVQSMVSTAFQGEFVRGRVVFLDREDVLEEDLTFVKIIGEIIGSRIDHLQAMDHVQRGMLAHERVRLARDLHDSLLQSLTGVALQLRTLPRVMARDSVAAEERVAEIEKVIAADQRDLRSFIDQLHEGRAAEEQEKLYDLQTRLYELRDRFRRQWGLEVEYSVDPAVRLLPAPLRFEIYNVVSEAVANAAKHAEAKVLRLSIRSTEASIAVEIEDDGHGFPFEGRYDLSELISSRRGPVTLKERVAALRGEMTIDSSKSGSRIQIQLPTSD